MKTPPAPGAPDAPIQSLIEDTRGLSQGVELRDELLASIAISLKRIADAQTGEAEASALRRAVEVADDSARAFKAAQMDSARSAANSVADRIRALIPPSPSAESDNG